MNATHETAGLAPDEVAALKAGLLLALPQLPARFLYDDVGSALFEEITRLEEYYQTRTELSILEEHAADITALVSPRELTELGSGSGRKIGHLVQAAKDTLERVTFLDVNAGMVDVAASKVHATAPGVEVVGVQGDFLTDLGKLGDGGRRMVVLFGGTLGNLNPADELPAFFHGLAGILASDDAFLVGLDLVKDKAVLEAAYNDSRGVTAAFNKNTLRHFSRLTGGDADLTQFEHYAFYDTEQHWIEMRLRARNDVTLDFPALDLSLEMARGEELRTEISCKYTRALLDERLAGTGLTVRGWFTDEQGRFALAVVGRESA